MAIVDPTVDPMAYLEEAVKPKPKDTSAFTPFFLKIGDGQKAMIRLLLNMPDYVRVKKHEYYDKPSGKWLFRNLCAADQELPCQCCLDVEALPETTKEEKTIKRKSRASERMVLPVYLHMLVTTKTGEYVTFKQDDKDVPVSGPRLLEMKPEYSTILHDLLKEYNHPRGPHDIRASDFKIECTYVDGFPKYDTTVRPESAFTVEVDASYLSKDKVFDLYWNACPPRIVGEDTAPTASTPAAQGAVKSAPDF